MDNFKDLIRKRFSQQYRGKNIIWSISLNEIKAYLNIKKTDPEIEKEVGGNLDVILCASHDTASAFESVEVDMIGVPFDNVLCAGAEPEVI